MIHSRSASDSSAWPLGFQFSQPFLVQLLLTVAVGLLVISPLFVLVKTSLTPPGKLPFEAFVLTFQNYADAFTPRDTPFLVLNTLAYALGSVTIALAIATAIAWLTERTDLPLKSAVRVMMFAWMAVPPLVMAFGWILLLNPGSGLVNLVLRALFNLSGSPFNVYSLGSMIFISGLGLVPTAFVMISGALRNMDPQLENAALAAGAGRWTALRRVTFPLIRPSLLSTALYFLMVMIQAFDIPLAIGLTARVPVLSTRIYLLSTPEAALPRYGLSAAFGTVLLVFALALMWTYFAAVRQSERFRVVTGRGFRPRQWPLGRWKWLALAFLGAYFSLMLLPLLLLLWTSLLPFYQPPSVEALQAVSLNHYRDVLSQSLVRRALGNTLLLVFGSATLVMFLASLISWYSVRSKGRAAKWLDALAFTPMAVPHIVMAMALLLLYIRTPLYGTLGILVLGHVTIYLAFGTRTMNGALIQIHQELEGAARVSGATWGTTLRRILLPLLWPHVMNGWLWVVAHSLRDLTVPLMLMTTGNVVLSSALWLMWEFPNIPGAAALAMLMVFGLLVLVVPLQIHSTRESLVHR
ncbi:MAG: iron ABC transporter permease [Deltaproteobacteria bacterium]|nr:iron ABC transporter permease [Deltaproteobacteria bacterium]